ncbi:MAG: hypothetical protein KAR35_02900, partial [Candidatus Heimdallarchaeota archaeon]|nr:hypothetical protein [Candidatus Heimdallarchaeota archaeon]MCK5048303.1 hypothetical protein [Candidatus Heimdallarchaeota archaeon]
MSRSSKKKSTSNKQKKAVSKVSSFYNNFWHNIIIVFAVAKRYLLVDFRYKFQLVVEAGWTAVNVIVFILLGAAWQATSGEDLFIGVPYDMITFFVVSTAFYTVFGGTTEGTVNALPEETSRGTLGLLITNSVTPISVLIGKYLASTVKYLFILIVVVVPALIIRGAYPKSLELVWASLIIFFIAWLFMGSFTLILASISLIFKKTETFNKVGLYVLRFISGAIVPIYSFDKSVQIFGIPLSNYLIWFPATFCLEAFRWLFIVPNAGSLNTGGVSSDGRT